MIKELMENGRFLFNWLRLKWLELTTDRVKRIEIKDDEGKTHEVTVERELEKVCAHKRIEQIDHIFWRCLDCDDAFFVIVQKLFATRAEVEQHVLELGRAIQADA